MLTSLAYIFLLGLAMAALCQKLGLPRILGMLATGMLLGPFAADLLDPVTLAASADLRKLALIIILIKAGLSLRLQDLRQVGRPAILLSFLPACCEILGYVLLAPVLLGLSHTEAALMGAVLAAVSPAVVVPRMVGLMEEGWGTEKRIPQMLLAGASMDDVFVIVLFTTFCAMVQGGGVSWMEFVNIPVSVVLGLGVGALAGWGMHGFFESRYARRHLVRNSMKVILILGVSFLLLAVEQGLEGVVGFSGLLAVMAMAMVLGERSVPAVRSRLQQKYGKLWLAAEVILFVLVGAAVDLHYTWQAGPAALALILLALVFRSVGVVLCMTGTALNRKERLYCVLAYLPKATVQAAIGSVPLSLGLPCGRLILSVAVLAIVVTAPLGAISMDRMKEKLLTRTPKPDEAVE